MSTAYNRLMESERGRVALCVELTITNVTELLCKHLDSTGMKRADLAKAMGVSPGRVTQLLNGKSNMTLGSIARAMAAFGQVLEVGSRSVDQLVGTGTPCRVQGTGWNKVAQTRAPPRIPAATAAVLLMHTSSWSAEPR